jgi:uncharacterized protein RhaS with RHS repeats
LYDYNARYYDPTVGRFVSADSIVPGAGNPQSLNRYSYTLNNPLKYTDPTGHVAKDDDIMAGDEDSPAWIYGIYDEQTKNRALHAWFNSHPDYNPATDSMSFAERQGWDPDGTRAMILMDYGGWQMDRASKGKVDFETAATYLGTGAVFMAVVIGGGNEGPSQTPNAAGQALIDDIIKNELKNVKLTRRPQYVPGITNDAGKPVHGVSSPNRYTRIGQLAVDEGRRETLVTIVHEEMHHRLYNKKQHNKNTNAYVEPIAQRFANMKGLR